MKKINKEDFVKQSKEVHNNLFDYSLVEYVNNTTKVTIVCSKHGPFQQTPKNHRKGHACPNCALEVKYDSTRKTNKEFIEKSKEVHGNIYDYSLVDYKSNKVNVIITCKKHGNFEQIPSHHYNGSGCPVCSGNLVTKDKFINKSNKIHGDYYDYSKVNYKNLTTKVIIICPEHGEFKQLGKYHIKGSGCPICNESKGEREIRLFLESNNIKFISQHRFNNCRDIKPLPFDFYLSELNMCVEYDGEQHFKKKLVIGHEIRFKDRQKKDKIKTDYCNKNNINLLRIRYNENIINKLKGNMKDT